MRNNNTLFSIIFALMVLFVQLTLLAQEPGFAWWRTMYENGLRLLEEQNYQGAREAFNAIIKRDKKIAEAYYGLGLVESAKNAESNEAIGLFEKAIKYNKDYAEAYYQTAMVFFNSKKFFDAREYLRTAVRRNPDFVEAWLKLGEVEAELDDSGEIINAYTEAVRIRPKDASIYSRLINAALTFHHEDKIIPVLEDLCAKHPGATDPWLDLAYMHYATGKEEKTHEILSSIPTETVSCRYFLLQAKLRFDDEKDEEGLAYYWSAVHHIGTDADASAFFRDLCYIMRNEEYSDLEKTPIDQVWEFYYRFWRSRDPNLVTEVNERIPEHYRRVKYARNWYRRHWPRGNDGRYKLEHPLREFMTAAMGDELLAPHLSQALPENIDIDDLGLIYVRHGNPDRRATFVNPLDEAMPQNLSWQYKATYERPEMIFHFSKWSGTRGWIICSLPATFAERSEFGGDYMRLDPARPEFQDLARTDLVRIYDLVERDNVECVRLGFQTETSDSRYQDIEPLDFPYQFVTFRGPQDKILVEFYYGIHGHNTELNLEPDGSKLMLEQFFTFHDEKWNDVGRVKQDRNILVGLSQKQWAGTGLIDVQRFNIAPGTYNFEVHLRDKISERLGIYKGKCTLPNYWSDSLTMSDILLSGAIKPAGANDRFVKEDVAYSPHMMSDYKINEEVGIYFEIYNLKKNSSGKTGFRLTCALQPLGGHTAASSKIAGFFKSLFDKKKGAVSTAFDYEGQATNERIYLNFGLNDQNPGNFELVVTVEDLNANTSAKGRVGIAIKR